MATAGCFAALDWKSISCAAHEIEFVCEYNYQNFLFLFVHVRACRASLFSLSTVLFGSCRRLCIEIELFCLISWPCLPHSAAVASGNICTSQNAAAYGKQLPLPPPSPSNTYIEIAKSLRLLPAHFRCPSPLRILHLACKSNAKSKWFEKAYTMMICIRHPAATAAERTTWWSRS